MVVHWLKANYKKTENRTDTVRTSDLFDKHSTYMNDLGRKPFEKHFLGCFISKAFGNPPYLVQKVDSQPCGFYGHLRERETGEAISSTETEDSETEEESEEDAKAKIICQWLKDNYKRAKSKDFYETQKLFDKFESYYSGLDNRPGTKPVTKYLFRAMIKRVFGELPVYQLGPKSISNYGNLRERTSDDDDDSGTVSS